MDAPTEPISLPLADTEPCIEPAEILDLLTSLVDKSLVVVDGSGEPRYRLLETVRQYAREELAEAAVSAGMYARHRDFFQTFVEEAGAELTGPEQAHWLEILEQEHENIRAALAWCNQDPLGAEKGLRMGAALQRFWTTRGYLSQGRERLSTALSRPEAQEPTVARAQALYSAGVIAFFQCDYAAARSYLDESLRMARELGDDSTVASSLLNLGNVANRQGQLDAAASWYEQSLTIWRTIGDQQGVSSALSNLGHVARNQGDHARARSLFEESLRIKRALRDRRGTAICLEHMAAMADLLGDYEEAQSLTQESLEIGRELGDKTTIGNCLLNLGEIAFHQGDYVAARGLFEQGLAVQRDLGSKGGVATALDNLGSVAHRQGDFAAARSWHEQSLAIERELGNPVSVATSLVNLAEAASEQHDFAAAQACLAEAVPLLLGASQLPLLAHTLDALAALRMAQGIPDAAARAWGAASARRPACPDPFLHSDPSSREASIAACRQALGDEVFATAWKDGERMPPEALAALADEPTRPA